MVNDAYVRLDGRGLFGWARRAADQLATRRAEINALNVFPVPDADTGSNLAHTIASAVDEAAGLPENLWDDFTTVAQALARGAIRGARGNSGVVLSQILRGVAEAETDDGFDGAALAESLRIAVSLIDAAIVDPVEGTVVTVVRATAVAATEAAASDSSLDYVLAAAVAAARTALSNTPSQLEALRTAGVVDAGGAGFVVLLEALATQVGAELGDSERYSAGAPDLTLAAGTDPELEVMFLFTADGAAIDALETEFTGRGTSLLIARGDGEATVHIHTHVAGAVIERAFALGAVSDLRIEVLPGLPHVDRPERVLVALTPPGSVATLYRTVGAQVVEVDATTMSSTDIVGSVLTEIRRSRAGEVILLPNGMLRRRELVAVDNATHAFDQAITLVPTRRVVSGIAALALHEPKEPLATAAYTMMEAAAAMRTATVAEDLTVRAEGNTWTSDTLLAAVTSASRRLLDGGGELVTLITAEALAAEQLDALEHELGVDVVHYDGTGLTSAGLLAEIGVE
ncbi:DAK2 domain-containing protein [Corynebacterium uterequi]|uniref:Putative kinase, dihydroxyacetone kinase n=1 Tax=Corynebacterium uterequi TaxID=1072256 RepID=A0A0G3HII8_9CORY|nr:DAK2 domain-containing protein [Corynebacterium uterequi]AKK10977.1 putative kinase, dihydroxyacetone kinase [Corynebacterium uterequi]